MKKKKIRKILTDKDSIIEYFSFYTQSKWPQVVNDNKINGAVTIQKVAKFSFADDKKKTKSAIN